MNEGVKYQNQMSFVRDADDVLAELKREEGDRPYESVVQAGTFTADFLRSLVDFPFEVSLRDRGLNIADIDSILSIGSSHSTTHSVLDLEGISDNDFHLKLGIGQEFIRQGLKSAVPVHTHPGGAASHCPSLDDIRPSRYESKNEFEFIVTQLGIIAYKKVSEEVCLQIKSEIDELFAQHPELHAAAKRGDDTDPALAELAQKELMILKRAGAVIAEVLWDDERVKIFVDLLNRDIFAEEAIVAMSQK